MTANTRITTPFTRRVHRRRGPGRRRPHRPARHRHRRRVRHRRRDRPRPRRRGRRGDPRRPRPEAGERTAEDIIATTGNKQVLVAPLDLADRASVAAFAAAWDGPLHILVNNAGVMACAADAHARGLGAAVRHQPPRPLRPGHRPARARSPRPAAPGSSRSAPARTCARPVVFEDIHFERRALRAVVGVRAVQDGERPVRGRGDPALGRRRHHRQRADARAGSAPTCSATSPTRTRPAARRAPAPAAPVEDAGAGRGHLGARWPLAAARRRRRPLLRGLQRGRAERSRAPPGVAAYALDPAAAARCGSFSSTPDFSVRPAWGTPTRRPWSASVQGNSPPVGGVRRRYVRLLGRFPAAKIPIGSIDPSRR